jgi:hypothetical protein
MLNASKSKHLFARCFRRLHFCVGSTTHTLVLACVIPINVLQGSVARCRRLLCLSKIAAHASGGKPQQARLQAQASARLRQLALQQELQLGGQVPLSSAQLVLAALEAADASQGDEAAEAAVAAVEALALMPEQQQSEQYR